MELDDKPREMNERCGNPSVLLRTGSPPLSTPPRNVMSLRTLNLGILAHIDAGKTSLTERLLFENGAIRSLGSVDGGNTATDSSDLERERGITIRAAVASFTLDNLHVNLVDTPGHPDFIAEVERVLSVLDGAVVVISAVEGVQAQTRVLMRSLARLRLPTLFFVNKIDRVGARYDSLLDEIQRKLRVPIVPMTAVDAIGTKGAVTRPLAWDEARHRERVTEVLADHDETLLAQFIDGVTPLPADLRRRLGDQTARGLVHPVYFGSAISGSGTDLLGSGINDFLPGQPADAVEDPLRGIVFAIERTGRSEKTAYVRLFGGSVRERERITLRRMEAGTVEEFGGRISRLTVIGSEDSVLKAGGIGKVRGLSAVRVGDRLGELDDSARLAHFSPPILESVVHALDPNRNPELHAALSALANEDPLIRIRPVPGGGTSVLLYGAVQKEVITERLDREFGVQAVFAEVQPVYFERPAGVGHGLYEFDPLGTNDFWQTVGIRVEPRPTGSGNMLTVEAERGTLPNAYHRAIEESALRSLQQGLHGWEVVDCAVVLTRTAMDAPMTVAADFRNLTPLVVMRALRDAGTVVYEPSYDIEVEVPQDAVSGVTGLLHSFGADVSNSVETPQGWKLTGNMPAKLLHEFGIALPGLTHGEGMLWNEPGEDRVVRGRFPDRDRVDGNPLNYDEYLRFLANRDLGSGMGSGMGQRTHP
ncbi:translation factor GTPase family protein [Streptomyces sp. NPDC005385]|uniref:translation factor GTPase family protein n=1 Tax=Streptomyces sp. NPDC005385 TaxID=3157039 RepID=UPI0033A871FC